MARPKIKIDGEQISTLGSIGATNEEIAAYLGVSADTIERRFAGAIKKGYLRGNVSLRRMQFEACQKGNTGMMVWLGKQRLGQTDKVEATEIKFTDKKEAIERLKAMTAKLEAEVAKESK